MTWRRCCTFVLFTEPTQLQPGPCFSLWGLSVTAPGRNSSRRPFLSWFYVSVQEKGLVMAWVMFPLSDSWQVDAGKDQKRSRKQRAPRHVSGCSFFCTEPRLPFFECEPVSQPGLNLKRHEARRLRTETYLSSLTLVFSAICHSHEKANTLCHR